MDWTVLLAIGGAALIVLIIFLLLISKIVKAIFKTKPKLNPAEQQETEKLKKLRSECDAESSKLYSLKRESDERANQNAKYKAEVEKVRQELKDLKESLATAEKEADINIRVCHKCNSKVAHSVCPNCGTKTRPAILPYTKVEWAEVYNYLHSICEWGEPADFDPDSEYMLLPWPTVETMKFTVGGINYEWGKMEDEENGEPDWWAYLEYEHPILGTIKLINKINSDLDHLYRDGYDNEEALGGGDFSELRTDIVKGLKQGLTALYIWLKSEQEVS